MYMLTLSSEFAMHPVNDQLARLAAVLEPVVTALAHEVAERAGGIVDRAPAPEPWLTVEEAAQYAGVKPCTIRDWVRRGLLEAGGHGRIVRVKASAIDALYSRARSKAEHDAERGGPVVREPTELSPVAHRIVAELRRA